MLARHHIPPPSAPKNNTFAPAPAGRWEAVADNRAFYYDNNHLSQSGASRLTPLFSTIFQPTHSAAKQVRDEL